MPLRPGSTASVRHRVTAADTASALGSGDLEVLGTPRVLAWCEAATVAAVASYLDPDATTVGTRVALEHARPAAVGADVTVTATLAAVDGRLLRFEAAVTDRDDAVLATATVTRVLVARERFLARLTHAP